MDKADTVDLTKAQRAFLESYLEDMVVDVSLLPDSADEFVSSAGSPEFSDGMLQSRSALTVAKSLVDKGILSRLDPELVGNGLVSLSVTFSDLGLRVMYGIIQEEVQSGRLCPATAPIRPILP